MTDHLRNSIDQIFPPEPPDAPRPEPTPPPDDALPESPLPCPKCGAPGVCDDGWFVGCSDLDCTLPEMMLTDWQRLARAVALLRAVDRLNAADALTGLHRTMSRAWRVNTTEYIAEAAGLADALIALAEVIDG